MVEDRVRCRGVGLGLGVEDRVGVRGRRREVGIRGRVGLHFLLKSCGPM